VSSAGSTLTGLATGDYDFAETLPAGWTLTGVSCNGSGLTGSVLNGAAGTGRITVAANASGTCTFTNTRQTGALTIAKTSVGDVGAFPFTKTAGPTSISNFTLTTVTAGTPVSSAGEVVPQFRTVG
jgi:hypothetical protein